MLELCQTRTITKEVRHNAVLHPWMRTSNERSRAKVDGLLTKKAPLMSSTHKRVLKPAERAAKLPVAEIKAAATKEAVIRTPKQWLSAAEKADKSNPEPGWSIGEGWLRPSLFVNENKRFKEHERLQDLLSDYQRFDYGFNN